MHFKRILPPDELKKIIECYWIAESSETKSSTQKIVPDGFPEIIFHFGDPYRIKMRGTWEQQENNLLAGQITKYFFLENSGTSNILGIKLKPYTPSSLFGIEMSEITDQVIPLKSTGNKELESLVQLSQDAVNHEERIEIINRRLIELTESIKIENEIEKIIDIIFTSSGTLSVSSICSARSLNERQLERLFKKFIGLSPKFYTRIVRFSNIFQLAQNKKLSWSEVGLEAGFYDQAHFIKDFKAFAGEDPSHYFFDEPSLANFFMKKN